VGDDREPFRPGAILMALVLAAAYGAVMGGFAVWLFIRAVT
jgi:hypothetical protein